MNRSTFATMKREMAERLAATALDGREGAKHVTVEQVRIIVSEYLKQLVRCPACDDEGTISFREIDLQVKEHGHTMTQNRYVEEGTIGPCPMCGGLDRDHSPRHDREWVRWLCVDGWNEVDCRQNRRNQDQAHAGCGYRIMLPLDGP
jgi:hypothetical protein